MAEEIEGGLVQTDPTPAPKPDVAFSFEELAAPREEPKAEPQQPQLPWQWPQQQQQAPAPDPNIAAQVENFKQQLTRDLAEDPGGALVKAALFGAQVATARSQQEQAQNRVETNKLVISNFKSERASAEPRVWKAVASDFNAKVAGASQEWLAAQTPSSLISALEVEWQAAKGRALDRVMAKAPTGAAPAAVSATPVTREEPPNYGGGGVASSTSAPQRSAEETADINEARGFGLTQAEIDDIFG